MNIFSETENEAHGHHTSTNFSNASVAPSITHGILYRLMSDE